MNKEFIKVILLIAAGVVLIIFLITQKKGIDKIITRLFNRIFGQRKNKNIRGRRH